MYALNSNKSMYAHFLRLASRSRNSLYMPCSPLRTVFLNSLPRFLWNEVWAPFAFKRFTLLYRVVLLCFERHFFRFASSFVTTSVLFRHKCSQQSRSRISRKTSKRYRFAEFPKTRFTLCCLGVSRWFRVFAPQRSSSSFKSAWYRRSRV